MALPRIGQTVYIDKQPVSSSGFAHVLDIRGNQLFLSEPLQLESPELLAVNPGDRLRISYVSPNQAMYYFESVVTGIGLTDRLASIAIGLPSEDKVVRIQRRAFVRADISVPVEVGRRSASPGLKHAESLQALSVNISGGGLAFYLRKQETDFSPGDKLQVSISLPGAGREGRDETVTSAGVIIRSIESENKPTVYSLRFEDINPAMQQTIVQHVFRHQIRMRELRSGR